MLAAQIALLGLVAVSEPGGLTTLKPARYGDESAPRKVMPVPIDGVWKDGVGSTIGCMYEPVPESEIMYIESLDATPCKISTPSGVMLTVQDRGAAEVSPERAYLIRGGLLVQTASLPFTIDNSRHVIDPQLTVAVGIQDSLLLVRSIEGDTNILACGGEKANCEKQVYTLYEGELLALENDGNWWAWEQSDGSLQYNDAGGCNTAGHNQGGFLILVVILFVTRTRLRRRKAA